MAFYQASSCASAFSALTPMRSMTKYNLDLLDIVDDRKKFLNFLRMEKWISDRPHHPGEAAKQWLKDLYQANKLVKGTYASWRPERRRLAAQSRRTCVYRKLNPNILMMESAENGT
jgi:hypothetical protein